MSLSFEAYKKIKDKEIDERNERMANVKAQREAEKKEREAQQKAKKQESTIKATAGKQTPIKSTIKATAGKQVPITKTNTTTIKAESTKTSPYSLSAGRRAQFQDSFQKTQQERWDKEAAARKEEEKAEKRENAMKYINSEGGITPDNFMEIKPYKNTYSDAAVRSAENMKTQLEKQAAELQKEIEYSRIRHEAMTKNGSFENAKKEKAYKDKLEENLSKLNKEINYYEDVIGIKATDRITNTVKGLANSTIATVGVLGETAKTALKDTAANVKNDELQELRKEYRIKESELNRIKNYGFINPEDAEKDKEYLAKKAELEEMAAEIENMTQETAVDMNSPYMKNYGAAQSYTEKATEGLEGTAKVLADTGISILDNAVLYPTAAISPAIPLSIMGAKASAAKAYELSDRGISAGETLLRAIGSGAVEAATEKIPLENLANMVKVGGNSVVKNLLKQSGLEATEEGLSYVGNYIIDRAANDPEASFSIQELALSMLQGGLSGLFFGAGGSAIDTAVNGRRTVEGTVPTQKVYEGADGSTYLTPEKELILQETLNNINDINSIVKKAYIGEDITNNIENAVENINGVSSENKILSEMMIEDDINTLEKRNVNKITRNIKAEQNTEEFQNEIRPFLQKEWGIDTARMDNIAQRIGSNVKYFLGENDNIEGFYENGNIYLNIRSLAGNDFETNVWKVFKHEFTHSLENTLGYNKFISEIENSSLWDNFIHAQGFKNSQDYFDDIREDYKLAGFELSNEEVQREAAARFVQDSDMFTSEETIRRLTEENPSLARDILNWIRSILKKVKIFAVEKINGKVPEESAEVLLSRAEDYYMKALFEAERKGAKAVEERQYSIKDKKDLMAIHNISEDKLNEVLNLGGYPMPSIAITRNSVGHEGFGDVSAVFGRETIDPELNYKNKIYSADAYTARFPSTEYKLNETGLKNAAKKLNVSENYIKSNLIDYSNGNRNNIINNFKSLSEAKEAFINENNIKIIPVLHKPRTSRSVYNNSVMQAFAAQNIAFEEILNNEDIKKSYIEAVKAGTPLLKYKNKWEERINNDIEKAKANEVYFETMKEQYNEDMAILRGERGLIEDATSYSEGVENAINENQDAFELWSENIVDSILGDRYIKKDVDPFDRYGNRKTFEETHDAYNIENIIKNMKKGSNQESNIMSGIGELRAALSDNFYSIDDVKKKKRNLQKYSSESEEMFKKVDDDFLNIAEELAVYGNEDNKYIAIDNAMENIINAVKYNNTEKGIKKELENYYSEVPQEILSKITQLKKDIKKIPVKYFEAKPERAVGLEEVKGYVVPSDLSEDLKQRLRDTGTEVVEYERENSESRREALNKFSDAQFSIKSRKKGTSKEQTESEKVRQFTRRASNIFLNDFKESMGISRFVENNDLRDKAEYFAKKSIEKGGIDSEEADRLFNEVYERSRIINDEFYKEFKELKEQLKNTKLYGGDNTSDIKKYLGSLRVTRDKNALPADSFYMELNSKYPDMFPESITNIEDQLDRMAEISKSIAKTEDSLKNYGTGQSKEEVRMLFDQGLQNLEENLTDIMRYKEQEKTKKLEREELIKIAEELKENPKRAQEEYKKNAEIKKEYTKLKNKEIITDKEEEILLDLVKGRRSIDNLPNNVNKGAIKNLYPKFKEKFKSDEILNKYRAALSEEVRELARSATANSDLWKDKKAGFLYSRETMERNFEDITKKAFNGQRRNRESKDIIDTYFKPIHENEAKATRLKNELGDRIRALKLDTNEKYNVGYIDDNGKMAAVRVSESGLVQLLGEGKIKETELKALRADVEKIKKAVNEFRDIYNKLFEMTNEALVAAGYAPVEYRKDYFPHFSETKPDTVLGKAGALVGINIARDELPTDIAGLTHTFRPGKKWVGNLLRREGDSTEYDALKGFDRYINGVADVIYHTEDIKKLRALEDELRYKYSSKGAQDRIDEILDSDNLTFEEKSKLIENVYNVTRASHLPNLVTELRNYTDNLAGKKSIADRTAEHSLGRGIYNFMRSLENKVSANMVAINPGSWATNWIPITQVSGVVRTDSLLKGIRDTVLAAGKEDGFKDTSDFLVNRRGSEPLYQKTSEKLQKKLTSPFSAIDNFTSEVVARSLYYDKLRKGADHFEAMDYSNDMAARIMADRSKGAQPTIFNDKNPVTKLFTMFQTEVNNQYGYFFKDVPEEIGKKASLAFANALVKMFLGSYLYNEVYEWATGRRAALDPLDMIITAVSDFADEDKKASEAVGNVIGNALDNTPFIGGVIGGGRIPLSSALPDVVTVGNTLIDYADGETSGKRVGQTIGKELVKPLTYIVPPVGGGQIKKAVEAGIVLSRGEEYSYDKNGDKQLKYAIEDPSALDVGKALVFGKSSLPAYREWGERNFKSLTVPQTQNYYKSVEAGISYSQYMTALDKTDGLNSDKDSKGNAIGPDTKAERNGEGKSASLKKKEAIDSIKGLSEKQKQVLYEAMDVSEKLWKKD